MEIVQILLSLCRFRIWLSLKLTYIKKVHLHVFTVLGLTITLRFWLIWTNEVQKDWWSAFYALMQLLNLVISKNWHWSANCLCRLTKSTHDMSERLNASVWFLSVNLLWDWVFDSVHFNHFGLDDVLRTLTRRWEGSCRPAGLRKYSWCTWQCVWMLHSIIRI